jgi:hypothetical protein
MVIITDRIPVARFPCGNIAYRIQKINFVKLNKSTEINNTKEGKEA